MSLEAGWMLWLDDWILLKVTIVKIGSYSLYLSFMVVLLKFRVKPQIQHLCIFCLLQWQQKTWTVSKL